MKKSDMAFITGQMWLLGVVIAPDPIARLACITVVVVLVFVKRHLAEKEQEQAGKGARG